MKQGAIKETSMVIYHKHELTSLTFIDLEKAYDSVCLTNLWRFMADMDRNGTILKILTEYYTDNVACDKKIMTSDTIEIYLLSHWCLKHDFKIYRYNWNYIIARILGNHDMSQFCNP